VRFILYSEKETPTIAKPPQRHDTALQNARPQVSMGAFHVPIICQIILT